ncbi:MAG: glutathione S-transferase family protein [Hyphomicrobiaceae bacterium]
MLQIYGRANSINVRKVLWVADEIGLTYQREDWGRGFRPTSEATFRRLNPFEIVPVIEDDGYILRESNTIVRYLTTKHGRSDLYPTDIEKRFQVEAWMDWANVDMYADARPVMMGKVFGLPDFQEQSTQDRAIAGWSRIMQLFESYLNSHGPFVMGEAFTIADIPAGLIVNRWFNIDFPKPALPATAAYYDLLAERPAYRTHGRNGTP